MADDAASLVGDARGAGALLFLAAIVSTLGILTAEALYPGYSLHTNAISDLGGTLPPNSVVHQPSAAIFDGSMIVAGLLLLGAATFLRRSKADRPTTILVGLYGLGVLGVGVLPEPTGAPHLVAALVTFFSGGLAAVASARWTSPPFRWFAAALGAVALLVLVASLGGGAAGLLGLGYGGTERWVAYPVILWTGGFGGLLLGRATPS